MCLPEILVSHGQFMGGPFHLCLQLAIKIFDAGHKPHVVFINLLNFTQHAIEAGGETPELIMAGDLSRCPEIARLSLCHGLY